MPNIRKKSRERFLTVNELRAILVLAPPASIWCYVSSPFVGLRPAQVLVLRIEDFEGAQLRVDEALKERQKGEDRVRPQGDPYGFISHSFQFAGDAVWTINPTTVFNIRGAYVSIHDSFDAPFAE